MKLSRILTSPFQTNYSPYEQDYYGLTVLSKPIPVLYPILNLREMDPSQGNDIVRGTTLCKPHLHMA